ncbi:hypothetical protein BD626DRAFT_372622, partial [Schizophyllum amplum]
PSLDQMNGPLSIIADELHVLAQEGVFVTRTSRFPFGRKVRVLLLHTTGDQPAIRQLCGFSAATSTNFCPYCKLKYQERNNIDYKSWTPRLWSKEKRYSTAYREAKTEKKRTELVDSYGLRWSPLHALRHYNPMRMALPDASHMMACIFRHHIRGIYGMSTRIQDDLRLGEDEDEASFTPLQELSEAWLVLRRGNSATLDRLSPTAAPDLAALIHTMQKPSWLPKPTSKPGDPSEGSLKSSSLRRLAEIWLPVSLIREWGPYPKGSRERRMLQNYMHLISASVLLHKRRTRQSIIRRYHHEAHRYLETRAELFPTFSVTPYEHIMLHFSWFLERYGPMQSWQQLLMEQRNGDLQKIPTNFKFG